jgi:DNA-binding NtrC family response regulator
MREKILVILTDPKALAGQNRSFYRKYNVVIANNSADVLEINRTGRHTVIVVVMEGPNERELSLLREIKAQDGLGRPIIAIANHNSIEKERAVAAIGVFYHLLGPFEQNDLNNLIAAALRSWNSKSLAPKPLAVKGLEVDK